MFTETKSIWRYLKTAEKPIIMYGMGDGAEKILAVMEKNKIKPSAFMASDEFVRGQTFCGFEVKKLSEIESLYGDFIIIVCFGTSRPDVLEKLYNLSSRYELYSPDVPVYGSGLFDEKYIAENIKKIITVRELLEDEISKNVFDRWIDYRISGKIAHLKEMTTPRSEALALFDIKKDGSEVFADLGAYDGDTIQEFLDASERKFKKIYALEPDSRNFTKLRRKHYALGSAVFVPINAAAWDSDGKVEFADRGGRHSFAGIFENNENNRFIKRTKLIETRSLDSVCKNIPPTIIKMDVEGCETKALAGSALTIKKHKPSLIISAYHRTEDMLELPLLIKNLNGKYRIFLRHHEYIPAWDTNLYCL